MKTKASPKKKAVAIVPAFHPGDPPVTADLAKGMGLSLDEYGRVQKILGRKPTYTELGIFSVMWSEHCSYKTSKPHLRGFPTKGKRVLQGPGENAGVLDIGRGWAVCFKIESHNHPSAIEPYQGAATGVGGILRDVFTMGARPIAMMNSLRFGGLDDPHVRHLFSGVVAGIAGYGNCMGIPTVAGEVVFDEVYRENCLVNAFALGVLKHKDLVKGKASGLGNSVIYIGATTGRDGIHGATFASIELSEDSEEKRSAVQVGDPFMEKLLLEATLELIQKRLLVGIQDMGAAGLTSSSTEMAFRGGSGLEIDTALVPKRETGMAPYEVMLSESQERMLLVAKKGKEKAVEAVLSKWGLHAAVIGKVTDSGHSKVFHDGVLVSDIPIAPLADDHHPMFPVAKRPMKRPAYLVKTGAFKLKRLAPLADAKAALLTLLGSPNIAEKSWVYRQYDHMVRTNTLVLPGSDAAVVRVKEAGKAVAMSVDGNGRYCYLDPYLGGMIAVAEAARNVAVSGAEPIGCTDCLNFGSPQDPEIMWQFAEVVKGMAEACRQLEIPVISGNVSLYNESPSRAIDPTPIVGVVGLIESGAKGRILTATQWFKNPGDFVYLAGLNKEELGGSEYLSVVYQSKTGLPPELDLKSEKRLHRFAAEAVQAGLVASAHDCSDGGLAVALAECCVSGAASQGSVVQAMGAEITLEDAMRADALLFGESQSRAVISCSPEAAKALESLAKKRGQPLTQIGVVGLGSLRLRAENAGDGVAFEVSLAEMLNAYSKTLKVMQA
ncbi:MAG: phosphoribosylformylglycinamidine synthase subunit PurL [candidate division FCPU426 bacterium]